MVVLLVEVFPPGARQADCGCPPGQQAGEPDSKAAGAQLYLALVGSFLCWEQSSKRCSWSKLPSTNSEQELLGGLEWS